MAIASADRFFKPSPDPRDSQSTSAAIQKGATPLDKKANTIELRDFGISIASAYSLTGLPAAGRATFYLVIRVGPDTKPDTIISPLPNQIKYAFLLQMSMIYLPFSEVKIGANRRLTWSAARCVI